MAGPPRHSATEMHRATDDSTGVNIAAGQHTVTDGAGGFVYEPVSGGASAVVDHGNMGAAETIDRDAGDWHQGVLDATCAITVQGFTVDEGETLLLKVTQNGTGGWDITWDPDVEFIGDDQPAQAAGAVTWYMLWSDEGNATIYASKVGAAGSSLTIENEGTPLATSADTIDFVGPLVTASGAGAEKTVTVTGALDDLTDVVVTSAAVAQRLRFDGTNWVNSALVWAAMTAFDGTAWLPFVDGDGNQIMAEV